VLEGIKALKGKGAILYLRKKNLVKKEKEQEGI